MDELCRTDSLEYVRSLAPPSAAVEKARVCLAGSEDEGAPLDPELAQSLHNSPRQMSSNVLTFRLVPLLLECFSIGNKSC